MNEENLNEFLGKRVFIILKSDRHYTGLVNALEDKTLYLIDKFNHIVFIDINEISSIEEKGGEWNLLRNVNIVEQL